jgi:AraC-like DNA-binding protein
MADLRSSDEASLAEALGKMGARLDPIIGLLDHLQGAFFWIKDTQGRFRWVNTAVVLRRGLKHRDEMIGKTDLDFFEPARATQFRVDDLYVLAGNTIRGRVEPITVNHGNEWFSTSKVPLRDRRGRVVGTAGLSFRIDRPEGAVGDNRHLAEAVQHIDRHFAEPVKNTTLARVSGMSLGNFQRQFRASYHCSPHAYIRQLRVRLSCKALGQTDKSLATIAEEFGFADQSHFTKEFRRMMKETPRAYRQRFRK